MRALVLWFCLFLVFSLIGNADDIDSKLAGEQGHFVLLQGGTRAYVAGPPEAKAGILLVHDYFGISDATKTSVEHLASLGYRVLAIDLYGGKSATVHEEAVKLMQSLDRKRTDQALQQGLDYLKMPGRKIATLGFSLGGQESLFANLNDPDAISATAMVYGFGFDKIDKTRLQRLKSPVLVIAGADDAGATQAALSFQANMKDAPALLRVVDLPGRRPRLRAAFVQ
jgi:carboxymethylenebutenolidase